MAGDIGKHARPGITIPLWSAGEYVHPLPRLISHAKDRHRWDVIEVLSIRLAMAVAGLADDVRLAGPGVLVPFPSRPKVIRERGLDFTHTLATKACRYLRGIKLSVEPYHMLSHARQVKDQKDLSTTQRLRNLQGSLKTCRSPRDRWIIVIDDVVTTGASLNEAVRALGVSGYLPVGLATVASTRLNQY